MKRILVFFLITVLLFSATITFAKQESGFDDAGAMAAALQSLQLFKGSDNGFELERKPTRMEALISLIRLCGLEDEALKNEWQKHPFTDVNEWADSYAAMAYETGLTKGVSKTEFGMEEASTAQQFAAFVARALGYSDENGDFTYDEAIDFGISIKIIDGSVDLENFLRADMVRICYNALFTKIKDESVTLSQKLQRDGKFTAEDETFAITLFNVMTGMESESRDDNQYIKQEPLNQAEQQYDKSDDANEFSNDYKDYSNPYFDDSVYKGDIYYDDIYYDDIYYDDIYYDDIYYDDIYDDDIYEDDFDE